MRRIQFLMATGLFTLSAATNAAAQETNEHAQYAGSTAHANMAIMMDDALYNNDGDEIGRVEGFVVGENPRLIVSVGEFLGLGGKNVLVPASEISRRADGGFNVAYTETQLEAMPEYADDNDFDLEGDRDVDADVDVDYDN